MLVDVPSDEDINKQVANAGGNSESGFDNGDDKGVPDDDDDDDKGGCQIMMMNPCLNISE